MKYIKSKKLFIWLFTAMTLIMSLTAVSLYDNAKEESAKNYDNLEYYYEDEFQLFTIDLAMQLDSSYQPLHFVNSIAEEDKTYLLEQFRSMLYGVKNFIRNDSDFYYIAKNTKSNQVISNLKEEALKDLKKSDYGYYVHIRYDASGKCVIEGDSHRDIYSMLEISRYRDNYELYNEQDMLVETPKNIDIQFMIPKEVNSYEGISGYTNDWTNHTFMVVMMLALFTLIIAFFILCYPISHVAENQPFKVVKEWSFEVNLAFWTSVGCLIFLTIIVLAGNTINGFLPMQVSNYGIANAKQLVDVFNIFVWLISLWAIGVICFLLKWILVSGPWKYIKEHSLIIQSLRYGKHKLLSLSEFDLSSSMNKTILKYVMLNGLITLFISFWHPSVAILFVILYSLVLYQLMKKRIARIQDDYNTLLSSIKYIVSEDFDKISEQDFGIFEASKAELNQLSENFALAVQEKVKSQKLKTELISNVSHDLKTPLTCIKNYLALLKEDDQSIENRHHYIEQLVLYTNRLKNLIDDLFEISKVDSGNISLNKQELDIVALLDQAYIQNEDLLEPKGLSVVKKYSSEKSMLLLDSDKTYRIFENLFTNIGKYALANSRVYLTVNEKEQEVEIEFSNISEVPMDFNAEEITERFVRGDKSRSKQGSGLGLAIARSFVEAQGGTFDITIDCDLFKVRIIFPKGS